MHSIHPPIYKLAIIVSPITSLWHRIQLFKAGASGVLVYKLVHANTVAKFSGLGAEEMMVYQACEKAGSRLTF